MSASAAHLMPETLLLHLILLEMSAKTSCFSPRELLRRCLASRPLVSSSLKSRRIVEAHLVLGNFSQSSRLDEQQLMLDRPIMPLQGSGAYMAPELKRKAMSSSDRPIAARPRG